MKKLFIVFTVTVMLLGVTRELNAIEPMHAYNRVTDGHAFCCTFGYSGGGYTGWNLRPGQKRFFPFKDGTFFVFFFQCQPGFRAVGKVYVPTCGSVEITGPVGHNITGLPIYKNISYDKHGTRVDSATFSNCVKW